MTLVPPWPAEPPVCTVMICRKRLLCPHRDLSHDLLGHEFVMPPKNKFSSLQGGQSKCE